MTALATETVLLLVAAGIAVLTVGFGVITLAMAWWNRRQRRRTETIRERMQEQLFEELFKPDPDWDELIADLSPAEREQLRQVVEAHLRRLRGSEYDRLCTLARKLGIQAEAKQDIDAGRDRFRALTWLALLGEPVESSRLEDCCTDSRQHREGAARVLFESDQPDGAAVGTELLLWDGSRPLSAFGMDTLYRLNNGAQTPLLSMVPANMAAWNSQLLVQVLTVLRYCSISEPAEQLEWLLDALDHESPQVRAATVGVIERHGWREPFQSQIDISALLDDPEPAVRYDVYQLLASWGSDQSAEWLQRGFETDKDREMLAVVRALSRHPRASLPDSTGRFEPFVDWVQAEAAVDRRRERVWGVTAAWT
jgi:hypothetical protein